MAVYKRDIVDINLETGNIHRSFLKHSIGYKDQKADHFGIRTFRDGVPVDLTGVSVQGIFMPPQGDPIAITSGNIVSGNVAEVVLPQACYNYDGQFCLSIKLVDSNNSVTGTMRIVDGMVDNTHASGTVAPTSAVPTYQEILSTYDAMVAATAAANGAIAPLYANLTFPVKAGQYAIVDGALKRAIVDIATSEAYTAAHWTAAKLGPDLSDLKSALTGTSLLGKETLAEDEIDKTETENTAEDIRFVLDFTAGKAYSIRVHFNSVTWNSNGTQFLKINSYSANSATSTYLIDSIRAESDPVSGDLDILYVPTANVKLIRLVFYLGAGEQDIEASVSAVVSPAINEANNAISAVASDCDAVSASLDETKSDMAQCGILTKTAFASGAVDETESEDTSVVVRLLGTYKKSNIYQLNFAFNSVVWKSNGTQFLQIKSYSANSTTSTYQVDVIRLDTEAVTGNALRVNYSPSTDTVKMIACTFFLGTGVQDIEINVDELSSQIADDIAILQTEAEHIMPVVELSENTASGTMESTYSTIYIPYNIYAGYRYRLMLACVVGTESGSNALKVWTASGRTTSGDYKQDVINDSAGTPLCGQIKNFATGDAINEEFVATKNATYFVLQYFGDINTNYQIGINVGRVASVEQVDEIINGRGIVALNKDVEPLVLQFGREISANTQVHTYNRLNFLFFSDIHAKADLWERICDYMDAYSAIIPFAIHGGDYVSSTLAESSVVDLYGIRKPQNGAILNTVGNHDCIPANGSSPTADAETVYNVLYHSADPVADGWDCTFGSGNYIMYWYKDIADAGVRIICLDQYHWDSDQATFLANALTGAKTAGYGVITVTHTPITTTGLTDIGSGFWTLDNWIVNDTYTGSMVDIRSAIDAFIDGGGLHIAHLCGHIHSDQICELTEDGIFQIRIQTASANELWTDTRRVLGTKTYDCFNVMQIDRNLGMVKLVRIGCNTSDCLQPRTTLCYDYVNKRVISNT